MGQLGGTVGSFIWAVIVIAIIYLLVRPNSPGPAFVATTSGALANVVRAATGQQIPAQKTGGQ